MSLEAALKYSGVAFAFGALTYVAQILPALATGSGIAWDHPTDLIVSVLGAAGAAGLVKALPWLAIVLKNAPAPTTIAGGPGIPTPALPSSAYPAGSQPIAPVAPPAAPQGPTPPAGA